MTLLKHEPNESSWPLRSLMSSSRMSDLRERGLVSAGSSLGGRLRAERAHRAFLGLQLVTNAAAMRSERLSSQGVGGVE